jgi:Uma2 family endonuclease
MAIYPTRTKRWTRTEYDHLIDIGFFQTDDRIELIGGELMVAEPQSVEHYTAICTSARALQSAFGLGWEVRQQGPIDLDDESEPEPNIAVVPGAPEDYRHAHPSRPVLTLEVFVSSLATDREHKASLYARAGLSDYWILNLIARVLEVYREPVADATAPYGWRYARREIISPSGRIAPLAALPRRLPLLICSPDARAHVNTMFRGMNLT